MMLIQLGPSAVWGSVVLVFILLMISAFFSSTEIAIFSLPQDRPATDDRNATLAQLRSDPHRLLVTLLVGNNIVNIAISSITTAAVIPLVTDQLAVPLATIIASVLVLVFGEILPKAYGLGHAESWSLTAARPLVVVGYVLSPFVIAFDLFTRRASTLIGGDQHIEAPYTDA